jgi:hypothetical protein
VKIVFKQKGFSGKPWNGVALPKCGFYETQKGL